VTNRRRPPSRRGRAWDEESIRRELERFLRGRSVWPTYEQFVQGGAKGVRDALYRHGGVEYWAKEMGLPGGDRSQGGVRHWTDETIRETLSAFFGDREDWPSQREFDEAGLHALREALRHYGGPERWAKAMGVVLPAGAGRSTARPRPPADPTDKRPRKWPPWSEQRIAAELQTFLDGREEWPRYREFVEAGQKQLYGAVLRNGGAERWARRTGVRRAERHGSSRWTEDRIRAQLAAFLAGRDAWPTRREFEDAGQRPLRDAVSRTGGAKRWAREFRLKRSPSVRRARPAANRRGGGRASVRPAWNEARLEAAILPLVSRLGRWPTKGEFRQAGLGAALSAVYDHGGSAYWRERLGVEPGPSAGRVPDRTRWSEKQIDAELREFCKGRTTWPEQREFRARKARALYAAVCRHGGTRVWRERLGLQ